MENELEKEITIAVIAIKLLSSPIVDFSQGDQWKIPNVKVVFYELDNYSDAISFQYGLQLAQLSTKVVLILNTLESQETGKVTDFINRFIKLRDKTHSLLLGEHRLLYKLLKKAGQQGFHHTSDEDSAFLWLRSIISI